MSLVVRFAPIGLTKAKYDATMEKIKAAGPFPPDGLDYHICFGTDGDLKVSEIWDSQTQFDEFGERLMPILAAEGIEMTGPPDVFEVENLVRR
jgi:hypothetical protein